MPAGVMETSIWHGLAAGQAERPPVFLGEISLPEVRTNGYRPPTVSFGRLLTFTAVAFVVIVIPGPSALFTISRALTYGRRTAVITVLGDTSGVYVQALSGRKS
jgi:hypothetical protein